MNLEGIKFLLKIYKDLAVNPQVLHVSNKGNKYSDVNAYLEKLNIVSNNSKAHDNMRHIKNMYYKKYVIKDVPESYFELQKQIALEQGYGYLEYTYILKEKEKEILINEQKGSLDRWIEYFASSDTDHYPTWFKYFVFQGVIRIGYYDKEKECFTKRTKSTVKPFIEINYEAIALMYDVIVKALNKDDINDDILLNLINNGNFSKIYAYCIKKIEEADKDNVNSTEGIWKKYEKGSDPNILFNDIHGKGTGWCTAGGIETATYHIKNGDFYVYYTKDKDGEFTRPRIAIRMERNKIAEVRGIGPNQHLESNMIVAVKEKLKEFPDGEIYQKKVKDMELLTHIYHKQQNNQILTRDELVFLYEISDKIQGFGHVRDPRIQEILVLRDKNEDRKIIFDGTIEEYDGSSKLLDNFAPIEGIILPKKYKGDISVYQSVTKESFIFPDEVEGEIFFKQLKCARGVKFPNKVTSLYIYGLESPEGLILPKTVTNELKLNNLKTAQGLVLPEYIGKNLELDGLETAQGLIFPKYVGFNICLYGLKTLAGLLIPERYIYIVRLPQGLILHYGNIIWDNPSFEINEYKYNRYLMKEKGEQFEKTIDKDEYLETPRQIFEEYDQLVERFEGKRKK